MVIMLRGWHPIDCRNWARLLLGVAGHKRAAVSWLTAVPLFLSNAAEPARSAVLSSDGTGAIPF